MDELRDALATNFRGQEALRSKLAGAPRFGNDEPAVDELARRGGGPLLRRWRRAKPTITGGHYKASLISYGLNVYEGRARAGHAPTDGRRERRCPTACRPATAPSCAARPRR